MEARTTPLSIPVLTFDLPIRTAQITTTSSSPGIPALFYCCNFGFTTKAAYQVHVATCKAHNVAGKADVVLSARAGTLESTAISGHEANNATRKAQNFSFPPYIRGQGDLASLACTGVRNTIQPTLIVDGEAVTKVKLPLFWCETCSRGFSTVSALNAHFDDSKRHKREDLPEKFERGLRFLWCDICNRGFNTEAGQKRHCDTSKEHSRNILKLKLEAEGLPDGFDEMSLPWCEICKKEFETEGKLLSHCSDSKKHSERAARRNKEFLEHKALEQAQFFLENQKTLSVTYNAVPPPPSTMEPIHHGLMATQGIFVGTALPVFENATPRTGPSRIPRTEPSTIPKTESSSILSTGPTSIPSTEPTSKPSAELMSIPSTEPLSMPADHVSIDLLNNLYACILCEREFFSYDGLKSHVKTSQIHKKEVKIKERAVKWAATPISSSSGHFPYRNNDAGPSSNATDLLNKVSGLQYLQSSGIGEPGSNESRQWSIIPESEQALELEALRRSCHSLKDLKKFNYNIHPYGPDEYAALQRCGNCTKQRSNIKREAPCIFHPGKKMPVKQPNGNIIATYSCCGASDRGCYTAPNHDFLPPDPALVRKYQSYEVTPPLIFSVTNPKRKAVTLDCEMAGLRGGASELILLCVADYFTGETLMNDLVCPTSRIVDWRSRYSGVKAADMEDAIAKGTALNGWKTARAVLWEHIDSDTILVGHSLQNDLDVLRMIHTNVVDSAILTSNALGPISGRTFSLKGLCQDLLGIDVQNHGRNGHVCLEDVMATREVVIWCMQNPEQLKAWGAIMEADERQRREEREKARQEKLDKKAMEKMANGEKTEGNDGSQKTKKDGEYKLRPHESNEISEEQTKGPQPIRKSKRLSGEEPENKGWVLGDQMGEQELRGTKRMRE